MKRLRLRSATAANDDVRASRALDGLTAAYLRELKFIPPPKTSGEAAAWWAALMCCQGALTLSNPDVEPLAREIFDAINGEAKRLWGERTKGDTT